MAKKNTLQDLDAFLKAQDPENVPAEKEASFLEKEPTQLVDVDAVEKKEDQASIYGSKKKAEGFTNEAELYQAVLHLAKIRKATPESIIKKLIEFREEEMGVEPENSWWDWVSETSSNLWKEMFD